MRVFLSTLALWGAAFGQQPDKAALRQQAMPFLTQARTIASGLPPVARRGILDGISLILYQADDKAGSSAVLKEALASERQDVERMRSRPQRPSAVGNGFAYSGAGQLVLTEARIAQLHATIGDKEGARAWIQLALENASAITDERERTFPNGQIASAQIAIGDLDAAQQTIRVIEGKSSLAIDRMSDIAMAKVRSGDVAAAKLMAEGQSDSAASTILARVAEAQANSGDFAGALETATAIGNTPLVRSLAQVHALLAIAEAEHKKGDEKSATQTFAVVRQVSKTAGPEIALTLARCGRFPEAIDAMAAIPDGSYSVKPFAYESIAVMAGNAKHPEIARQSLALAKAAIEASAKRDSESESPSVTPAPGGRPIDRRQGQFQDFAIAQAQAGDIEGALQTARDLTDQWRRPAFDGIASAQARQGDIAGAEKTLAEDPGRHNVPPELAEAKARAGDFEGAFQLARSGMPNGELERVFRTYCKPAVLQTCAAAIEEMTFPPNRALALLGIAENLLGVSQPIPPEVQQRLERNLFDPTR